MKAVSAWSPLHEGEIAVQKRVGVLDEVSHWAPMRFVHFCRSSIEYFLGNSPLWLYPHGMLQGLRGRRCWSGLPALYSHPTLNT